MMNGKISGKGFTLVELAIVLVIIGLLVGGVLAGQTLIEQARINKIISEYREHTTAITTFRSKYGQLPGDFNKATTFWGAVTGDCNTVAGTGTQTCNGNNDEQIDYDYATTNPNECWRVWQHLSNAGLEKGQYTGVMSGSYKYIPGSNAPAGVIENSVWAFFYFSYSQLGWTGKPVSRNVFIFGSINSNGRWYNPVLTPTQQYSIDNKIDDGKPNSGIITYMSSSFYDPNCVTGSISTTSTDSDYNISYNALACTMFIDYK